uniref:Uncharacterized protein n=1 Tax=uncultured marine virus TaxID=186617 RepID=A0A0F7L7L1_9VIRU|nr:hypothetical protein [uncultured marine virus]
MVLLLTAQTRLRPAPLALISWSSEAPLVHNKQMNSSVNTPLVGITGLIANITLEQVNTTVAIAVGLSTLIYMLIKIRHLLKNKQK